MKRSERLFNAIVVMGAAMTGGCGGSRKSPDPVQNTVSPMEAQVADAGVDAPSELKPKEVIMIL